MKPLTKLTGYWQQRIKSIGGKVLPLDSAAEEPPLRAELFSADQMQQHGVRLAAQHHITTGRNPDQLLARLDANEAVLIETCRQLTLSVAAKHRITPAAEWLQLLVPPVGPQAVR